VDNHADAAGIVLVAGVVKANGSWQSGSVGTERLDKLGMLYTHAIS
jgi:hypothetical protein